MSKISSTEDLKLDGLDFVRADSLRIEVSENWRDVNDNDLVLWRTANNDICGSTVKESGLNVMLFEGYKCNGLYPERRTFVVHITREKCENIHFLYAFRQKYFLSPLEYTFYHHLLLNEHNIRLDPIPNYPVKPYYIDLALVENRIAIEIDGHEFHKTKTQRTHDARRDRFLTKKKWKVIRFTGTEIYKNVEACVKEVISFVKKEEKGCVHDGSVITFPLSLSRTCVKKIGGDNCNELKN